MPAETPFGPCDGKILYVSLKASGKNYVGSLCQGHFNKVRKGDILVHGPRGGNLHRSKSKNAIWTSNVDSDTRSYYWHSTTYCLCNSSWSTQEGKLRFRQGGGI